MGSGNEICICVIILFLNQVEILIFWNFEAKLMCFRQGVV